MIEMKSTFPFFASLPPIRVVDSMTKDTFYLKLQEHTWKTFQIKIQTRLTEMSCAQQLFTAVIINV